MSCSSQLRDIGARVDAALCVIDRHEGGAEALACIVLRALFTRENLHSESPAQAGL